MPADQDNGPSPSGLGHKLGGLAVRGVVGFAVWLEKRRVAAELNALDDRELADIGLVRTDIDRVADGSYQGKRLAA
ncbi:MAG: DUF1127 domain-containing protein [Rhodospirillales bacterium]|nr:DUF1127 domain-containing protein [Rhodospirillales bacterium]